MKSGDLLAGVTDVEIKVQSEDHDALTAACMIHSNLHTIKSMKIEHNKQLAFTICEFLAGKGYIDIPKDASMRGTIRYFEKDVHDKVVTEI